MTRAELLRRAEILERAAEMAPIAFAPDDAFIDGWPPWVRCSRLFGKSSTAFGSGPSRTDSSSRPASGSF